MSEMLGRRERKKAATRKALADAALELFLQRGFDAVSVRDVAEAADVSTATLFKHFPSKEALLFDEEDDRESALVAAVRDRAPGQSIPAALRDHLLTVARRIREAPRWVEFLDLIESSPALRRYSAAMWTRHEGGLARAIAAAVGAPEDDISCAALACFALEVPSLIRDRKDIDEVFRRAFALLEVGWSLEAGSSPGPDHPRKEAAHQA
jgi:AcrR family transcriptional regulator